MILPIGWYDRRRDLGRVADFCRFCRGFQPFRLLALERVRSFYLLPTGGRILLGHSRLCETCGTASNTLPGNYPAISHDEAASLETLIEETNPSIRSNYASRLLLEDRIKSRKLSSGERTKLLREPFEMADAVLEQRSTEGQLDFPSQLGCLGVFILPALCMTLLPMAWSASGETIEWTAIIVGVLCLALAWLSINSDGRRHARRDVLPKLVASIRPLDPSHEEIETLFESLRGQKSRIAEVLRPGDVSSALMNPWG